MKSNEFLVGVQTTKCLKVSILVNGDVLCFHARYVYL